jgi:hypothetical protein
VVWAGASNVRKHVCFSRPAAKEQADADKLDAERRLGTLTLCDDALTRAWSLIVDS